MRIKRIGVIVIVVLCTAYWLLTRPWAVAPLTTEEQQMTDKLFEQTKPQCIGRYLFDVPNSFTNTLASGTHINDIKITSKRLYRPAFEQRIRLREQKLKNSSTVDPEDQPFLKQVYRINENTVIFDRNKNESVPGFGRILEGHLYDNGVAFIVTTEITDLSDEKYQKDREDYLTNGMRESSLNDKLQKLTELQSLLSRLKGRADDEIPNMPGVCISDGFINDSHIKSGENISMLYHQHDFFLAVNSNNTLHKGETLLDRGNEINPAMILLGAHTMKKGKVSLPDIDAEEWLIKGRQHIYRPEDKNIPHYKFTLYGNEKVADYKHPIFSVGLHNSGLEVNEYNDSQLVDIWERITESFRYRPSAF